MEGSTFFSSFTTYLTILDDTVERQICIGCGVNSFLTDNYRLISCQNVASLAPASLAFRKIKRPTGIVDVQHFTK